MANTKTKKAFTPEQEEELKKLKGKANLQGHFKRLARAWKKKPANISSKYYALMAKKRKTTQVQPDPGGIVVTGHTISVPIKEYSIRKDGKGKLFMDIVFS